MHREQLLECLASIKLTKSGYCIFGGACLAIRDIRATDDIDLYVTPQLYKTLKRRGWQEKTEPWPEPYLVTKVDNVLVEAYQVFDSKIWQPRFGRYLKEPEIVAGYRFMPLDELYEWKATVRRPKDVRDLELIDAFRAKQKAR